MQVSDGFKQAIQTHLDQVAAFDTLFAETLKKPAKNIDDCCTYITNEVQKLAKGNNAIAMAPDEVFKMAIHYYDEDDIVVTKPTVAAKVVAPPTPKPTAKEVEKTATKKHKEAVKKVAAKPQPVAKVEVPKPVAKKASKAVIVNQPTLF